ncbi:MAG: hypothetical protein PHT94_03470 [Candidatus Nanoarchaeia archaeon]|nr:hypothetical protein [Candidatus Nanoarchaeia archaeon]
MNFKKTTLFFSIFFTFIFLFANVSALFVSLQDNRTYSNIDELCSSGIINENVLTNFVVDETDLSNLDLCGNYDIYHNKDIFSLFFIEENIDFMNFRGYTSIQNVNNIIKGSETNLSLSTLKGIETHDTVGQTINRKLFLNSTEANYFTGDYMDCFVYYNYSGVSNNQSLSSILSEYGFLAASSSNAIQKGVCQNLSNIYFLDKLVKLYYFDNFKSGSNFQYENLTYTTDLNFQSSDSCIVKLFLKNIQGNVINLSNFSLEGGYPIPQKKYNGVYDYFEITKESSENPSFTIKHYGYIVGSKTINDCEEDQYYTLSEMSNINISLNFHYNNVPKPISGYVYTDFNLTHNSFTDQNKIPINNVYFKKCVHGSSDISSRIHLVPSGYDVDSKNCVCDGNNYNCTFNLEEKSYKVFFKLLDKENNEIKNFLINATITKISNSINQSIFNKKTGENLKSDLEGFDFISKPDGFKINGTVYGPYNYNKTFSNIISTKIGDNYYFEHNLTDYPMDCDNFGIKTGYITKVCGDNERCTQNIYNGEVGCCYSLYPLFQSNHLCIDTSNTQSDIDSDGRVDSLDACPTEKAIQDASQLSLNENCNDEIDNNCNGLVDSADPFCDSSIRCEDNCSINIYGFIDPRCNNQPTNWGKDIGNQVAYSLIDSSSKVCCLNPVLCRIGEIENKYYCGQCPVSYGETIEENTLAKCTDGSDNDGNGLVDACDRGCRSFFEDLVINQGKTYEDYILNNIVNVGINFSKLYDTPGDLKDNNCNGYIDEAFFTVDFNIKDNSSLNQLENVKISLGDSFPKTIEMTNAVGIAKFYFQENPNEKKYEITKQLNEDDKYYQKINGTINCDFSGTKRYCEINESLELKSYKSINLQINDSSNGKKISYVSVTCNESQKTFKADGQGSVIIYSMIDNPSCIFSHSQYLTYKSVVSNSIQINLTPKNNIEIKLFTKDEFVEHINYEKLNYLEIKLPFVDDFNVTIYYQGSKTISFYNKKEVNISLLEFAGEEIEVKVQTYTGAYKNASVFVSPIACMKGKSIYIKENKIYKCDSLDIDKLLLLRFNQADIIYKDPALKNLELQQTNLISTYGNLGSLLRISNEDKILIGQLADSCSENQKPVISGNDGYCVDLGECYKGTFFLKVLSYFKFFNNLTPASYCYYDTDKKTNFEAYKSCEAVNSCYSYNSKTACEKNSCSINLDEENTGCRWNDFDIFSTTYGSCVPNYNDTEFKYDNFNCSYDLTNNTFLFFESVDNFNFSFKNLSYDICKIKGNTQNQILNDTCYFTYGSSSDKECVNRNDRNCQVYRTKEDCVGSNNISVSYNINSKSYVTRSNDSSGYGWCSWDETNNVCIKDIDEDGKDDCSIFSVSQNKNNDCYNNLEWPNITIESSDVISNRLFIFRFSNSNNYFNKFVKKDESKFYLYFNNKNLIINDMFNVSKPSTYSNNVSIPFDVFREDTLHNLPIQNTNIFILQGDWIQTNVGNGYHNMSYIFVDKTKGIEGQKDKLVYVDSYDFDENRLRVKPFVKEMQEENFIPIIKLALNITLDISNETYLMCTFDLKNKTSSTFDKNNYFSKNNDFISNEDESAIIEIYRDERIKEIDLWKKVNQTQNILNMTNKNNYSFTTEILENGNYTLQANCVDATGVYRNITKNITIDDDFYFSTIEPFGPIITRNKEIFNLTLSVPFDSTCSINQLDQFLSIKKYNITVTLNSSDKNFGFNFTSLNLTYLNNFIDNLIWLEIDCNMTTPFFYKYNITVPIIYDDEKPEIKVYYYEQDITHLSSYDITEKTSSSNFHFVIKDKDFVINQTILDDKGINETLLNYYKQLRGYYDLNFDFSQFMNQKTGESSIKTYSYFNSILLDNSINKITPTQNQQQNDIDGNYSYYNYTYNTDEYSILRFKIEDNSGNVFYKNFTIIKDTQAPELLSLEGNNIKKIGNDIYYNSNNTNININYLDYFSKNDGDLSNLNNYNGSVQFMFDLNFIDLTRKMLKKAGSSFFQEFNFSNNNFKLRYNFDSILSKHYLILEHNAQELLRQNISVLSDNMSTPISEYSHLLNLSVFAYKTIYGNYNYTVFYNNSNNNVSFILNNHNLVNYSNLYSVPLKLDNFYLFVEDLQRKSFNLSIRDQNNNLLWSYDQSVNKALRNTIPNIQISFEKKDNLLFFICDNASNCNNYTMKYEDRGPSFNIIYNLFNTTNETLVNYSISDLQSFDNVNIEYVEMRLYQKGYNNGSSQLIYYPSYRFKTIDTSDITFNPLILESFYSSQELNFDGSNNINYEEIVSPKHVKFNNYYTIEIPGFSSNQYLYNFSEINNNKKFKLYDESKFLFEEKNNKSFFYENTISGNLTINFNAENLFYAIQSFKYVNNNSEENQVKVGNFTINQTGEYLLVGVLKDSFGVKGYEVKEFEYKDLVSPNIKQILFENTTLINGLNVTNRSVGFNITIQEKNLFNVTIKMNNNDYEIINDCVIVNYQTHTSDEFGFNYQCYYSTIPQLIGQNNFTIKVYDQFGNYDNRTFTIYKDIMKPTIDLIN